MPGYPLKRLLDIAIGLALLIATSPFLLLALVLTLLDGHRQPLFTQKRMGLHGREFTIYKFRTMTSPPAGETPMHCKPDAKHLTPIARFMRKASLDELPQFINVLKGDMSLIGPRPHALEYARHYAAIAPRYYERYRVRPGLACIVEVTRLHYLTEQEKHLRMRIATDLYYVDHLSFALDCKIFYKTMLSIAKPLSKALQGLRIPSAALPAYPLAVPKRKAVLTHS